MTVYGRALIVLQNYDPMRDPVVVELHVWRGEDSRGVETGELWQGRQVSQDQSSGLAELYASF